MFIVYDKIGNLGEKLKRKKKWTLTFWSDWFLSLLAQRLAPSFGSCKPAIVPSSYFQPAQGEQAQVAKHKDIMEASLTSYKSLPWGQGAHPLDGFLCIWLSWALVIHCLEWRSANIPRYLNILNGIFSTWDADFNFL